ELRRRRQHRADLVLRVAGPEGERVVGRPQVVVAQVAGVVAGVVVVAERHEGRHTPRRGPLVGDDTAVHRILGRVLGAWIATQPVEAAVVLPLLVADAN